MNYASYKPTYRQGPKIGKGNRYGELGVFIAHESILPRHLEARILRPQF